MRNSNLSRSIVIIAGLMSLMWLLAFSDINPLLLNHSYRNFLNNFIDAYPTVTATTTILAFLVVMLIGCYGQFINKRAP